MYDIIKVSSGTNVPYLFDWMISAAHTWHTWLIIGLFDDFWSIQLDDHDLTFYALPSQDLRA